MTSGQAQESIQPVRLPYTKAKLNQYEMSRWTAAQAIQAKVRTRVLAAITGQEQDLRHPDDRQHLPEIGLQEHRR